MSSTLCPAGMLRLRVTNQTVYPASTNGRNLEPNIPAIGPRGTSEPGPPGIHTSVFDPSPHRAYSIPLTKVPVSAAGTPFIAPRAFATASAVSAAVPKPTTAVRFFMTPPIPLSPSRLLGRLGLFSGDGLGHFISARSWGITPG